MQAGELTLCDYNDPIDRSGGVMEQREDPATNARARQFREKYEHARMPGDRAKMDWRNVDALDHHNPSDGACRGERLEPLMLMLNAFAGTISGDDNGVTWRLVQTWVFDAYREHMQG